MSVIPLMDNPETTVNGRADRPFNVPQITVAQLGARRHYLVPATLHAEGMLSQFFTDLYADGMTGLMAGAIGRALPIEPIRRMTSRRDAGLPKSKVHSFPGFALQARLRGRRRKLQGALTEHWMWAGRRFCRLVAARGFAGAEGVYAYSSAALELFERAKSEGRFCILDHATAPKRFEDDLTTKQAERYAGWAQAPPANDAWADEYADRQNEEAMLADIILCGSTFVRNAVHAECGQGAKCVVVPLGLRRMPEPVPPKRSESTRPLRVLFVGDDAIRKGIGDLSSAVEEIGTDRCEARVAGNIDLSELGRREASRTLTLLGSVPRAEMKLQYEWADVCVLPSVSDTFGLVILEAMSHGVPVITTPNTGGADVISDGRNGFLVPIMAPSLLAEKLSQMDQDRHLVEALSASALERSRDFGIDHYAKKLTSAINNAYQGHRPSSDR